MSVQRVLEMTGHIDCMPKDLVAVLEKDPVLTGRILNLVNSAYFSLARRVGSIRHALVYLGLNTIKHLAMGLAAVGAMPNIQRDGLSMVTFQSDALACGEATRIAGRHLMVVGSDQDHLYLLGLFHNLGDVICAAYAPDEWTHYQSRKYSNQEEMDSSATELFGATPGRLEQRFSESGKCPNPWLQPSPIIRSEIPFRAKTCLRRHYGPEVAYWRRFFPRGNPRFFSAKTDRNVQNKSSRTCWSILTTCYTPLNRRSVFCWKRR